MVFISGTKCHEEIPDVAPSSISNKEEVKYAQLEVIKDVKIDALLNQGYLAAVKISLGNAFSEYDGVVWPLFFF